MSWRNGLTDSRQEIAGFADGRWGVSVSVTVVDQLLEKQ